MQRLKIGRKRGSVATVAFVAVIPLVAGIVGFAVDCMHVNDAKGELQRATDAAALAGAEDLSHYTGNGSDLPLSASNQSTTNQEPLNFALIIGTANAVDGPYGLWSTSSRSITATIGYDSTLAGPTNKPNRCDVTGTIHTNSLFSQVFGSFGQTISTTSSAGQLGAGSAYLYAPIVVSLTDLNLEGQSLSQTSTGSTFTVDMKTNAAWGFKSDTDNKTIIEDLGNGVYPGTTLEPELVINQTGGVTLIDDNGKQAAGKSFNLLDGHTIVFPITSATGINQLGSGTPTRPIIGFFAMNITGYSNSPPDYSLTGTITSFSIYSTGPTISQFYNAPFANSGAVVTTIRLIQ